MVDIHSKCKYLNFSGVRPMDGAGFPMYHGLNRRTYELEQNATKFVDDSVPRRFGCRFYRLKKPKMTTDGYQKSHERIDEIDLYK